MIKNTEQAKKWSGKFGKNYTKRNVLTVSELNRLYKKNYGITREELNKLFIGRFQRNIKILEVGSNVGNQLLLLKKMGFKNLWGIEINKYAVELSKMRTSGINIIQSSAFDIPFKNGYFDMVFTSGVLIHISPHDNGAIINEIYRCSKKWIWGFEYYDEDCIEVPYRKHKDLLWRANYAGLYLKRCPHLSLLKSRKVKYLKTPDLKDEMFLLRKNK